MHLIEFHRTWLSHPPLSPPISSFFTHPLTLSHHSSSPTAIHLQQDAFLHPFLVVFPVINVLLLQRPSKMQLCYLSTVAFKSSLFWRAWEIREAIFSQVIGISRLLLFSIYTFNVCPTTAPLQHAFSCLSCIFLFASNFRFNSFLLTKRFFTFIWNRWWWGEGVRK